MQINDRNNFRWKVISKKGLKMSPFFLYMQLDTPSVVPSAVSTVTTI